MRTAFAPIPRSRRGTALVLMVVLSVIITGMVMALAWTAGVHTQITNNFIKSDRDFYAAEAIANQAMWQIKQSSSWRPTASTTPATSGTATIGGYSYAYTLSCATDATISGAVDVKVVTTYGGTQTDTVSLVYAQSTPAPQLANSGNGNISGSVTITGNEQTSGAVNANSNLHITGNLQAGGAINGSPVVSGTKTANVSGLSNPSVATIYSSLKSQATYTMNNPSSISVIDFTAASNGIIFINGDANINSSPTIYGTGTLVISGNWNQSANFPNSGSQTINIVCQGDINSSGKFNINGSLYAKGNWNQSGAFSISGVTLITGDCNVSGAGTISSGSVPTWDPRATGGSGTSSVSGFMGALP
jgi:Tfp pilus assembly protein PilX